MNIKNNQKGVVLYMTVVMMSILLSVILGLSTSIIGGLQLIVMIEDSIKSFYAADAGIEKALYNINSGNCNDFSGVFENDYMGSYDVTINYDNTGSYDGTISALGSYDQSRKKNEVLYNLPDPFPSLPFSCGNSFKDCRDGNTYPTVSIGSQCWIGENLNYETTNSYCYDNDDANCNTYGRLYNWEASLTACPNGWHLPSHNEWTTLERSVCNSGTCEADFPYDITTMGWRGTDEGTKIKSGGSSGFNALMAGIHNASGSFLNLGSYTDFWSSSESSSINAWIRYLYSDYTQIARYTDLKTTGFSVRCVKD